MLPFKLKTYIQYKNVEDDMKGVEYRLCAAFDILLPQFYALPMNDITHKKYLFAVRCTGQLGNEHKCRSQEDSLLPEQLQAAVRPPGSAGSEAGTG
jgi:hypothetical protein